jgi:hypothetical protein
MLLICWPIAPIDFAVCCLDLGSHDREAAGLVGARLLDGSV